MLKKYAGVGARKTPEDVLIWMRGFGQAAASLHILLRSGAASGADAAFEWGCDDLAGDKEIFLPWKDFNDHPSDYYHISSAALSLAEDVYGPRWEYLSPGVKNLMARNCYQILGFTLDDPVDLVVCWTPDGAQTEKERTSKTGGTGQAIALADRYGIPVFNIQRQNRVDELMSLIAERKSEI